MLSLLGLACGSSSDESSSSSPLGEIPSAFSGFCAGELLLEKSYLLPVGPGSWQGNGQKAPPGTKVLLVRGSDKWEHGIGFLGDGTPVEVEPNFFKGLTPGTDVTTACGEPVDPSRRRLVVLRASTVYSDAALTEGACSLPAGTAFASYSYSAPASGAKGGSFGSPALMALCGYASGYTGDLVYSDLATK